MLKLSRLISLCIRLALAAYGVFASYIVLSRMEGILASWTAACVFYAIGHALCKCLYYLADAQVRS